MLGDVRRVRDHDAQASRGARPAGRRTTNPARAARASRRSPAPARLARATASALVAHVGRPHLRRRGARVASASASAPEPVPRSATANDGRAARSTGRARPAARRAATTSSIAACGDDLGLGAGDEHPPVDEEVEPEEVPRDRARTAAARPAPRRSSMSSRCCDRRRGRRLRARPIDQLDAVVARHPLDHPARLDSGASRRTRSRRAAPSAVHAAGRPTWSIARPSAS